MFSTDNWYLLSCWIASNLLYWHFIRLKKRRSWRLTARPHEPWSPRQKFETKFEATNLLKTVMYFTEFDLGVLGSCGWIVLKGIYGWKGLGIEQNVIGDGHNESLCRRANSSGVDPRKKRIIRWLVVLIMNMDFQGVISSFHSFPI